METFQLTRVPVMRTGMLIRRPPADVFEAIVDPEITTQFWFTRSTGRLALGTTVRWEWEMYDISVPVAATAFEPPERLVIVWPGLHGPTTVEWRFLPYGPGATFVTIAEAGFAGDGDELVKQVTDSTQGFSLLLAGLKAFLEHGVRLNLVADRYPAGVAAH